MAVKPSPLIPPTVSDMRGLELALLIVFLATLCAPALDLVLRPASARSPLVEGRNPAPAPTLEPTLASWTTFAERFETWHADVFGLRDFFLRTHNAWKIFGLRTDPSPEFVVGPDQWLFTTVTSTFENWRGVLPMDEGELEAWRHHLERRRAWLARRGIEFLFVIVPSKQELYPEYVPQRLAKVGPSRFDQLQAYLERTSDFRALDLRPVLLASKAADRAQDTAYFPLGTPGTARGAVDGTRALLDALRARFPALPTLSDADVVCAPSATLGDTLAEKLYLADVLRQSHLDCRLRAELHEGWRIEDLPEGHRRRLVTRDAPELPSALVFHDSFGEYLYELLPVGFSSTLFEWYPTMDRELIKSVEPSVVIQIYVDRVLATPLGGLEDEGKE